MSRKEASQQRPWRLHQQASATYPYVFELSFISQKHCQQFVWILEWRKKKKILVLHQSFTAQVLAYFSQSTYEWAHVWLCSKWKPIDENTVGNHARMIEEEEAVLIIINCQRPKFAPQTESITGGDEAHATENQLQTNEKLIRDWYYDYDSV